MYRQKQMNNLQNQQPSFHKRGQQPSFLQRNLVIKTSESVGTLNSISQYTDRSFVVKDNSIFNFNSASKDKESKTIGRSQKKKVTNYLDHLKQLCQSDQQTEKSTTEFMYLGSNDTQSIKKQKNASTFTPSFHKFCKENDAYSSRINKHNLNQNTCEQTQKIKDALKKQNNSKNGAFHHYQLYESQEQNRKLYQNGSPKHQNYENQDLNEEIMQTCDCSDVLEMFRFKFNEQFSFLEKQIDRIEDQNTKLIDQHQIHQKDTLKLQQEELSILQQIQNKKHQLFTILNEKNQLQLMLKDVLFTYEIDKRKKKDTHPQIDQNQQKSILSKIKLNIQKV